MKAVTIGLKSNKNVRKNMCFSSRSKLSCQSCGDSAVTLAQKNLCMGLCFTLEEKSDCVLLRKYSSEDTRQF